MSTIASLSAQSADRPGILLLGKNPAWLRAVRHAAGSLGTDITDAETADQSVALLAGEPKRFSHFVVEAGCCRDRLLEFVGLTIGEAGSGIGLLVLGSTDMPDIPMVRDADADLLEQALAPAASTRRQGESWQVNPFADDELRAALTASLIDIRYQPIVSVFDGRLLGLEALARLNHPVRGTLKPDLFVPQMEQAGLGSSLSAVVVARVLSDIAALPSALGSISVSVNLPLQVLRCPTLLPRLDAARRAVGVSAEQIVLELTESRPVRNVRALSQSARAIRAAGYGLALDDVTAAMPSLDTLLDVSFSAIKLDKSLLPKPGDAPDGFVRDVIARSRGTNARVIAEGVEDQAMWQTVASLGADAVQGYFVGRPLPASALGFWYDAWRTQVSARAV